MAEIPAVAGGGVAHRLGELLARVAGDPIPVSIAAWDGSVSGPVDAPRVVISSPNALRRLLWHPGELGAAQAYVMGELDVPGDIGEALAYVRRVAGERGLRSGVPLSLGAALLRTLADIGALGKPLPPPASQAAVRGRLHSLRRDRAAISHHYDLSNDFYAAILDPSMAYSSAYWTSDAADYTLADAQRDKLDMVCRKIGLRPGMRFLDVGCGWGSLSLHAASTYGVDVVGVTISAQQKAFIDRRIADRRLSDRVRIFLRDYREITEGPFDAVASIEMGEHVGEENYPAYVRVLRDNVKPGGRVLVQQMSRRPGHEQHPGGGAFIESFIAPDMFMRPVGATVAMIEESGLEVRDVHAMREHYIRTVDAWYDTFESRWQEIVGMVGEEIARVWRLYLVGGRMAFRDDRMGVDQILAVRPDSGRSSMVPEVRTI